MHARDWGRSACRWLEVAAVYLVLVFILAFFQFQTPYLPEVDGYYHIKMAYEMRTQHWVWHSFPWTQFSLWKDSFSDGCFLFHILLMPFTIFKPLAFGGKAATVFLAAAAFTSLYQILKLHGARYRLYWILIAFLGGEYFTWRMSVLRPQILSLILLLWCVHFLLRRRVVPFAIVNFVYALSYVASFMPLVFAGGAWIGAPKGQRKAAFHLLMAGFGAQLFGFLVHPYFPKNFRFFYVQNFYSMYLSVFDKVNLYLGSENFPLNTRQFVSAHFFLLVHLLIALWLSWKKDRQLSPNSKIVFFCSTVLWLMACIAKRFTEYAVPMSILFFGLAFTDLLPEFRWRDLWKSSKQGRAACVAASIAWIAFIVWGVRRSALISFSQMKNVHASRFEKAMPAILAVSQPGDTIYTCDWDNAPDLFYFDDTRRYLVMMDPTFMYYWNPKIWQQWFWVANGQMPIDLTIQTLEETFKTHVGVCPQYFANLRNQVLNHPRFKMLYEDSNVYVFSLEKQKKSNTLLKIKGRGNN